MIRKLSQIEAALVFGGESTITVTGRRIEFRIDVDFPVLGFCVGEIGNFGDTGGGTEAQQNSDNPQDPGQPIDCIPIHTLSNMSQRDRDNYNRQRVAGRIHRQILDRSDSSDSEYASIIYKDQSGNVVFTPLPASGSPFGKFDVSAFNADTSLWGRVLGFIHNHPYSSSPFPPNDASYYARPSPDRINPQDNSTSIGDWITFDWMKRTMADYGASQDDVNNLTQYISGPLSNGSVGLWEYKNWDRDFEGVGRPVSIYLDFCTL